MISISSCLCALLLASYTVAAPAAAPSAPVSSAIALSSALSSAVSSAAHSSSHSSTASAPTATSTAAGPEATKATIDLDPNEPLWNINSTGTPEAIRGSLGASVLGPTDEYTVKQNPDLLAPPSTDHGSVKNAKWAFSLSHNRLENGGWARQENIGVMPIATEMASVNMRLEPGAVRELHWHKTAEWAYILKGHTQISAVDYDGKNYVATMGPGDLWYFPAGIPHSLQATSDDPAGAEFVLVFDTGDFSEDSTFLLTDWLAHVPAEVIAKNFQTSIDAFKNVPADELYIFPTTPPSNNAEAPKSPQGTVPSPFSFEFSKVKATQHSGGTSKIVDTSSFPISKTITAAEITIEPGAMRRVIPCFSHTHSFINIMDFRELHWHPTDDEWSFFIEGNARMTIFAAQSNARTFDYQAGDIGYVPATMGHYVENIGNTTVRFLEIFKTDKFQDISLNQWLALTPPDLVKAHLGLSDDTIAHLSKVKNVVVGPK